MKSGICPKCRSRRIILHNSSPSFVGGDLEFYTCADCAYTEWYTGDVRRLVATANGESEDSSVTARWINQDRGAYR